MRKHADRSSITAPPKLTRTQSRTATACGAPPGVPRRHSCFGRVPSPSIAMKNTLRCRAGCQPADRLPIGPSGQSPDVSEDLIQGIFLRYLWDGAMRCRAWWRGLQPAATALAGVRRVFSRVRDASVDPNSPTPPDAINHRDFHRPATAAQVVIMETDVPPRSHHHSFVCGTGSKCARP